MKWKSKNEKRERERESSNENVLFAIFLESCMCASMLAVFVYFCSSLLSHSLLHHILHRVSYIYVMEYNEPLNL